MTVPRGLLDGPIYLDYNATTPIDPAVTESMLPYLTAEFGNPSSTHHYGRESRIALDHARDQVAALLGTSAERIVFTGSGSEADNLAIRGTVLASGVNRPHVITQPTEHPAVLQACEALRRWHNAEVTFLPVDTDGLVDPADLTAAINPRTVLVSVMAANNETGALQPIDELARIAREYGVVFHTDAAQAIGKIQFDATELDLVTVVGHKMYAPKGIGALCIWPGVPLEPLVYGGGQEHGLRAGTENVALAVALGTAAELAAKDLASGGHDRIRELRDRLHHRLTTALPGRVHLNGPGSARLPNTLNISIDGIAGHELLDATTAIAASTGSACHSGNHQPSPVLTAMGMPADRGLGALRLSLGRWSTAEQIDQAAHHIVAAAS
ncbi:cysteine desulfurase family protein [Lentzea kentuckyensis]|uniref:cysteine desulfurase family protein n=1 Tax=Lentzea kentuckyensis TaxID=360086 RepID=UPI000A393331|nr:cysteine desulfurase family protein [Lentzea kentuckyensis]